MRGESERVPVIYQGLHHVEKYNGIVGSYPQVLHVLAVSASSPQC